MLETRLKMRAAGKIFEDFTYYSTEMTHFGALPCTQNLSPLTSMHSNFVPPYMCGCKEWADIHKFLDQIAVIDTNIHAMCLEMSLY